MEKEKSAPNAISDELLNDVSGGIGMHCEVLYGMSPEVIAATEEYNVLMEKIMTMQNTFRTHSFGTEEYEARSNELYQLMQRAIDCMGIYMSYIQGANSNIRK